jgi:tetratricopeptide (TPR) repeat protein
MLAIARVLSWSKKYENAIEYYNWIIQLSPLDPVPYREKARTALWDKNFDLAMATYNQVLKRPVDDLEEYLIQESVLLEKRAKELNWNKRYICALDAYKELLALNPGNEDALFDYAQVYCNLGLCDYSRNVYEHILNIDPNHNLVKKAIDRNEMRNNLGLQSNFSYWREVGSGTFSASQIARYRLDEVFEIPLTCRTHMRFIQQEYVENPFLNFKFYPAEGQTIEADCLFNEHVSMFFSATYKNYFHKFRSTITSHNRLLLTVNDYLQVLLSCNKEDEIYNFFSLKQAIQSNVSLVTLSSTLTRLWNISGTYQYYRYNDHNSQVHFNLLTEYQLTEEPNVLKVILQGDYRNAAHQTVSILIGTQLVDMIHPYWTPDKYLAGALTLEWRHDYRQFEFCEAPQRYIDIKITYLRDNAHNPSISGVLEWKHEFDRHWGFEMKGFIQRGPLWKAEGAWGTMSYRF